MIRHRPTVLPALVLAVAAAVLPAAAQDRQNGATWYRRSIEAFERLDESDLEALRAFTAAPGRAVTPQIRTIVDRGRFAIELACRGSRQDYADFELDYSQGFDLLLPHLGRLRDIGRLIQADAAIRLEDGDAAAAAELLGANYRMAGHLGSDRIMISSLVGAAVFTETDRGTQLALDRAAFGAGESAALAAAVASLDQRDPFDFIEAVTAEQWITVDWLSARFSDEHGATLLAEEVAALTDNPERAAAVSALDEAGFNEALVQYDRMMDRAVDAFALDDPAAAQAMIDQLDREIAAGEHGPLTQMLSPAYARLYARLLDVREMLRRRREILQAIAAGAVDPREEANAVVFYLRAVDMLRELKALDRLRDFDADHRRPMEDELVSLIEQAQPILAVLVEGSRRKRCDFSIAHGSGPLLAQPYAAGLRDLCRLVHADALRLLREGDARGGCDRLCLAYRFAAHLGRDEAPLTSLVAHAAFRRAHEIAEHGLVSGPLPAEARPELLAAFEQISRKDPFGYVGSQAAVRRQLQRLLVEVQAPAAGEDEEREALRQQLGALSGDDGLTLLAVLETMARAAAPSPPPARQGEPAPAPHASVAPPQAPTVPAALADVLSSAALESVRRQAHLAAESLSRRDLDFLNGLPAPAAFDTGLSAARPDLRRGFVLLRPAPALPSADEPQAPEVRDEGDAPPNAGGRVR